MINIPSEFKIASFTYTVKFVDNIENGECFGQSLMVSYKILIANRIKENDNWIKISDLDKLNTFWHELFHIFHYYMDTNVPEHEAQTYANFMVEYLQSVKNDSKQKD